MIYLEYLIQIIIHTIFYISGLELLNGWGDSDGQVNGVRYFKTEPYRAVFVTVDKISPYREYMNQETSSQHQVKAILHRFFD